MRFATQISEKFAIISSNMWFFRNKFVVVFTCGVFAAICMLAASYYYSSSFSRFHTQVFDTYQQIKPRKWAGTDVVVIDLDEASIKRVGQWPWSRRTIAELTDRLGELGAATIVFDIVFSEPDRTSPLRMLADLKNAGAQVNLPDDLDQLDNDKVLAKSFTRHKVITGMVMSNFVSDTPPEPKAGHGISGTIPEGLMKHGMKALRNLPVLDEAATGIGVFNFNVEGQFDSIVRHTNLLTPANDRFYPTLSMEALRVVQGAGSFKIKSSDGSGEISGGNLAIVSVQVGALDVPTDALGRLSIYHSLPSEKPVISAREILFPSENGTSFEMLSKEIANHIVLVGTSAEGLLDLRSTPLKAVVPGVTIHADIIDQIISGTFISRPDIAPGVEFFIAAISVLILLVALPKMNSLGGALLALVLIAAGIVGFWLMFSEKQLLFSPILPTLTILAAYAVGTVVNLVLTEREERYIRDAFGHYLAPSLVDRLANNPDELTLGGEERELTLLFCDIRGFTGLSEGLDPTELTELLNDFLTPMTTILMNNGATIDKYMGDAIMAFWNAPIFQEDHRSLACKSLLEMQSSLQVLNQSLAVPVKLGIGLNTGMCCVGNLGSTQRFNYSAIGDAVNVASRVEGLTKQYGLENLVSEETMPDLSEFAALEVDCVSVAGRDEPLTVFTLLGDGSTEGSKEFGKLKNAHEIMMTAYKRGNMNKAASALRNALKLAPPELEGLYKIYQDRITKLLKTGIPRGWTPVHKAKAK